MGGGSRGHHHEEGSRRAWEEGLGRSGRRKGRHAWEVERKVVHREEGRNGRKGHEAGKREGIHEEACRRIDHRRIRHEEGHGRILLHHRKDQEVRHDPSWEDRSIGQGWECVHVHVVPVKV